MSKRTETKWAENLYVFRAPDGRYMRVVRDGGMERAMWEEWTPRLEDATKFDRDTGLLGDHRWPYMVGDSVPIKVKVATTIVIEEIEP